MHYFKVHKRMEDLHGLQFHKSADALCLCFKEAVDASCLAMLDWRHRVIMELADGVDTFAMQADMSTVSDVPV